MAMARATATLNGKYYDIEAIEMTIKKRFISEKSEEQSTVRGSYVLLEKGIRGKRDFELAMSRNGRGEKRRKIVLSTIS